MNGQTDAGREFSPYILPVSSQEALADHLSGRWQGPILEPPTRFDVASSSSSASSAPADHSFGADGPPPSLFRRILLRPCKALLQKFFLKLFRARIRLDLSSSFEQVALDVCSEVYLHSAYRSDSPFVQQAFTCRVARGETNRGENHGKLSSGGKTARSEEEEEEEEDEDTPTRDVGSSETDHHTDSLQEIVAASSDEQDSFSALLQLFGLLESSEHDTGHLLDLDNDSRRARLLSFGWTVSDTPCPHPFFGTGRVFWRFASVDGVHCLSVHPTGIFRVGSFWPGAIVTNSEDEEGPGVVGSPVHHGGDDVPVAQFMVARMQVFSKSNAALLFDIRACFERTKEEDLGTGSGGGRTRGALLCDPDHVQHIGGGQPAPT